jgi:hypothetical protein
MRYGAAAVLTLLLLLPALPGRAKVLEHAKVESPYFGLWSRFDGDLATTLFLVRSELIYALTVSTEPRIQFDVGANYRLDGWYIQSLVGLEFAKRSDGRFQHRRVYTSMYLVHWEPVHSETHLIVGLPTFIPAGGSFQGRQILALPIVGSRRAGGRLDLETVQGEPPTFRIGPLIESDFGSARLSAAVQWEPGGSRTRYLLALLLFP